MAGSTCSHDATARPSKFAFSPQRQATWLPPPALTHRRVEPKVRLCEQIAVFGRDALSDMNERRTIADEAVGQRPASATPDAARDRVPEGRPATSAGPHASVATKTAEALGETVAGAYAYPDATAGEARSRSRATVRRRAASHGSEAVQPLMIAAVGFAVGYVAALLIHRG
jgi:hypothetical protein